MLRLLGRKTYSSYFRISHQCPWRIDCKKELQRREGIRFLELGTQSEHHDSYRSDKAVFRFCQFLNPRFQKNLSRWFYRTNPVFRINAGTLFSLNFSPQQRTQNMAEVWQKLCRSGRLVNPITLKCLCRLASAYIRLGPKTPKSMLYRLRIKLEQESPEKEFCQLFLSRQGNRLLDLW